VGIIIVKDSFRFQDSHGYSIQAYRWKPEGKAKAVIQIAHGMAEHSARYESFANKLVENGYGVYINDHIGHGKTIKEKEEKGHLPKDGFNLCVDDLFQLTQIIKAENPGVPVVLLGHSMGSFFAQEYITKYGSEINGCILSGSSGKQGIYHIASLIAMLSVIIQGRKARSPLMGKLSFGNFNNKFKPARTSFDWLSKDTAEVDKYVNDPLCGFVCTTSFYYEFYKSLDKLHKINKIRRIPRSLPVYIFSGEKDPVSNNSRTVKKLVDMYKTLGLNDVEYKIYENGRHEMLNETNREEVISDIICWLDRRFQK
jgi:alpha-beta hydrolase superfamily lysophospholipase